MPRRIGTSQRVQRGVERVRREFGRVAPVDLSIVGPGGSGVSTLEELQRAYIALGLESMLVYLTPDNVSFEGGLGVTMGPLPDWAMDRMERNGYISLRGGGYTLSAEMP